MKRLAVTAITGLLLAGWAAASSAQAPALAVPAAALPTSVPSDLPRAARPLHYQIEVVPDAANLTFSGTTSVDVEVFERTDTLTLHANELDFSDVRLFPAGGRGDAVALEPKVDRAAQSVQLRAPRPIAPGTYRLVFRYRGTINTQATGLFALDYPDKRTGETVRGLFTQFEAPDARRFAPMFDEPSYKATFDLSAVVPADQMAVSNMPIVREEALAGGDRKRVTFATTPKMSSYLLFFALGDFERLATRVPGGIDVGIISPLGSGEHARLALEGTPQLLAYYTDYFGVPYPLPKLDNIAAPGQSQFFGAMENWGAILTFEKYLLVDPTITDPATQNYQYTALAHEIAHQWFGNIVTMAWWDDLWLNEGFASWMETKASARFRPDWFPLLTRVDSRERAMALDGFVTTHPVIQPIRTVSETNQAFDAISYSKGEAVIAMLEAYAGEDTWRDGIRAYIRQHSYGNTTSDDLWRAVEAVGARGLIDIAHDFTLKPGVPLVRADSACRAGTTVLSLTQGEFSRDRKEETAASPQHWRVPLLIQVGQAEPVRRVLDGSATVELPGCGPVVVNGGQLGYFRTVYSPAMAAALVDALPRLAAIDQLGLLRDSFALAEAGYQSAGPALDLLAAVPVDANPLVAQGAVARWDRVHGIVPAVAQPAVAVLAHDRWLPRLRQLGFDPRPGESLVDTDLRSDLLRVLGRMGDDTVAAEARRRLAAVAGNPKSLDGPLKTTWLGIVARNATAAEWDRLAALAAGAPSAIERQAYLTLLGAAKDPVLAQKALDFALTGEAGTTSAAIIATVAAGHPDLAFDFAIAHRGEIEALVDASGRAGYIAGLAAASREQAMVAKLERYRQTVAADEWRGVDRRIAEIRERLATEPRLAAEIGAWLADR